MTGRIYIVRDARQTPSRERLVRASNKAQAIRHVAEGSFSADVAGQNDLVFLIGQSVAVENVGHGIERDSIAGVPPPVPPVPPLPVQRVTESAVD